MSRDCYVFFDVDDTLIEWLVSWPDAFVQVAREAGLAVAEEQVTARLHEALDGYYHECVVAHCATGEPDLRAFWLDYDGRILAALGVKDNLRHYAGRVWDLLQHPAAIQLYPEVPEALRLLAEGGAKLGIVTGRPRARPDLERLGVAHFFDPILDAFATRGSKSRGPMFRLAAEAAARAGLKAWHVGDRHADDVVRARAAGLRPILLDRGSAHPEPDCPRISELTEVAEIVLNGR